MTNCMRAVAWWFGSSSGLYTILFMMFLFGVLAGWGSINYLPDRLRRLLGV